MVNDRKEMDRILAELKALVKANPIPIGAIQAPRPPGSVRSASPRLPDGPIIFDYCGLIRRRAP